MNIRNYRTNKSVDGVEYGNIPPYGGWIGPNGERYLSIDGWVEVNRLKWVEVPYDELGARFTHWSGSEKRHLRVVERWDLPDTICFDWLQSPERSLKHYLAQFKCHVLIQERLVGDE